MAEAPAPVRIRLIETVFQTVINVAALVFEVRIRVVNDPRRHDPAPATWLVVGFLASAVFYHFAAETVVAVMNGVLGLDEWFRKAL